MVAQLHGKLCQEIGQYDEALSYYEKAMEMVKDVQTMSIRTTLAVVVQDCMAICYYFTGREDEMEKMFKCAFRDYEKGQGHFALATPIKKDMELLNELDEKFVNVLLRYTLFLVSKSRSEDASTMRQRVLRVV
ncbi:unnamed protein product [Phytophthora lilii]|uniref:Unnamed protein product n=1 Tax=Phytophthora lilii TaxID=2077276 RepID=A0A9W7CIX2_9STRA|nr:unnamed protein product [Phytophthora lilii]